MIHQKETHQNELNNKISLPKTNFVVSYQKNRLLIVVSYLCNIFDYNCIKITHFYAVKHIFRYCINKNYFRTVFFCGKICAYQKNVVLLWAILNERLDLPT